MPQGINADNNYKGTGGRVAIETRVPVDRTSFAAISAHGNWQGAHGAGWVANKSGGSGTVVFRDATRPNGLLVIAQKDDAFAPSWKEKSSFHRCPAVSEDGNWTFDAIEFGHRGYLRVRQVQRSIFLAVSHPAMELRQRRMSLAASATRVEL